MNSSKVTRWMIATAALAVAAGSASAQTYTAEIPMPFRVGKTTMAPGLYRIRIDPQEALKVVSIRNLGNRELVVANAAVKDDVPKAWAEEHKPALGFECVGETCALRSLWNAQDSFAYLFSVRNLPVGEKTVKPVMLKRVKAD